MNEREEVIGSSKWKTIWWKGERERGREREREREREEERIKKIIKKSSTKAYIYILEIDIVNFERDTT